MQPKVYLNGQFVARDQATISVMDRGFLFGDGVYEVIPCYAGQLFRLEHHLQRLDASLQAIRLANPMTHANWRAMLDKLVGQLPDTDQSVYLQVTRGADIKRDHAIPEALQPTVFAMTSPTSYPDARQARQGICAITLPDERWLRCNIKAITLLANVLLRSEAKEQGAEEAILVRNGFATEGAASNLFLVRNGFIITPPKGPHLLPGITRDLVLELAQADGMPIEERAIAEAELAEADEIWLTSSTREVMPVISLNQQPVADGRPGPIFERMVRHYTEYRSRLQRGESE